MKKSEIIEIKITNIDNKGKSYSIIDDKKIIVDINAAKDQLVRGIITKIKKDKVKLSRCEIIDYSNRKNTMYDNLEKQLAGASYQYYTYEEQLNLKNNFLKRFLNESLEDPIESVDKVKYRNKMEFSFGNEFINGPLILGLHKQNSVHDIIDVSYNKLMDDNFNNIYMFTNKYFNEKDISFFHRKNHIGYLRNLVIRKSDFYKEILVNLVTTSQLSDCQLIKEYKDRLIGLKLCNGYKITGILHTINDDLADMVKSEKEYILYGKRDITERILNLDFNISPYSFFQTNSKTVELLYSKVLEYIDYIGNVNVAYDLFSGTGTISQIIAKKCNKVIGIEIVEEAVEKAKENTKNNNLNNCEFIAGDVFEKLDEVKIKPDLLILDPPRVGVLEKNIDKLVKYEVNNIIYISCNPISLESDLKYFKSYGYEVKKSCMVDMFPYTKHMETVALLSKLDVDKHISVKIELD